jgi:hypothetical protein
MMNKLLVLICAAGLLLAVAGTAQASYFVPGESVSHSQTGSLPGQFTYPNPRTEGMVTLVDNGIGGHDLVIEASVFSTVNRGAGTSLYTGVPIISNVINTFVNNAGVMESGFTHTNFRGDGSVIGPFLGGVNGLTGQQVIMALGVPAISINLALVGGPPGIQTHVTVLGAPITVTGGPWVSGVVTITGVTTNVISYNGVTGVGAVLEPPSGADWKVLSTGGGFVTSNNGLPVEQHTVTLSGSNGLLSGSQEGSVTLIAPLRVNTGTAISGRVPSPIWTRYTFVPEPGVLLMLVAGAIALATVGRRRMRK